jgi:cellulose synthase/poly-beta-1,6-N-acetylglucosamine synthase-like glycosyltransferase
MSALHWPHITVTGLPGGLSAHPVVVAIEVLLFAYFLSVNAVDFALIAGALRRLRDFVGVGNADALRRSTLPHVQPVSIVLPVYNEEEHVLGVMESLLNVRYPQYEVIVVNDGSRDGTLEVLKKAYNLVPVAEARYVGFKTQPVRQMYRSMKYPNVRVIDKENGGKGDALNAGINESRYPLLFVGDGDSFYTPDVLEQMIQPFIQSASTVGCGASLRIVNEARVVDGVPVASGLPRNLLVRFQIVEYLRAALNSRFGWLAYNGIMCISGACALWKKDVIVGAGGYAVDTVWEDAEMTVRVHHYMRARRQRYNIAFIPVGVCWTHVPERLRDLAAQRISWHRHISETVSRHRNMLFRPGMGTAGWFALPAYVFNEWLAPVWLMLGIAFWIAAGVLGILSWEAQLALLAVVFALTALKMAMAFMLDEVSYRTHGVREIWSLFVAAMFEQIGYRQLQAVWSLMGILQFCLRRPIRGRRENIAGPFDAAYRPAKAARQAS